MWRRLGITLIFHYKENTYMRSLSIILMKGNIANWMGLGGLVNSGSTVGIGLEYFFHSLNGQFDLLCIGALDKPRADIAVREQSSRVLIMCFCPDITTVTVTTWLWARVWGHRSREPPPESELSLSPPLTPALHTGFWMVARKSNKQDELRRVIQRIAAK